MERDFSEPQTPNPWIKCVNASLAECEDIAHPHWVREADDDGDDDEISSTDPSEFDGGFGNGSYFQHAMQKDD
jgi:hypothetical protein